MQDFRLSEAAWEAAAKELRNAGRAANDDHRRMIEYICDLYVLEKMAGKGKSTHPSPAKHAEAWTAVAKATDKLTDCINALEGSGAAELQSLSIFSGGDEVVAAVRDQLPRLYDMAFVVSQIEAHQPRVHSKIDEARNLLARSLLGFWGDGGRAIATTRDGPDSRFLAATYSEALVAADEPRPTPAALREVLRKYLERRSPRN